VSCGTGSDSDDDSLRVSMSRGVRDLRQLITESRQVLVDDSNEDELENSDNDCCQVTDVSSRPVGQ